MSHGLAPAEAGAYGAGLSMQNVQLVEELLATVARNDVERAVELCDPELEFVDVLAPMEQTVRDVRGERGLRDWFAGLHADGVERVTAEPADLRQLPDGRVIGAVVVTQEKPGNDHAMTAYGIWETSGGRLVKIDSFFDRALALRAAGLDERVGLARRWVEGVVSSKIVDRQTVRLQSAEHDGAEFSVGSPDLWKEIEVGAMGIAETDGGELLGWRPLAKRH
jgi:ketosteroid isomerase-like protein